MATTTIVSVRVLLFAYLLSLCLLCSSLKKADTLPHREKITETQQHDLHLHTFQLSSLLPSPLCNHSTKASERKSSLKIVHKHGPCSELNQHNAKSPSHTEILLRDQARVKSIHSRLSKNLNKGDDDIKKTDAATLPAYDGSTVGAGNYIVKVGIGRPKKDLSLMFDTGSDLTWTQCQPCVRYCYNQTEPIYNPSVSKTYTNVSCSSTICDSLASATGNSLACASSTCVYGIQYGDSSYSIGFFSKETLTLTSKDVFPNFLFGCGQNNRGLFGGAAGLLGLGRNPISLVSQTAKKYNKLFSYCLPSSSSSTGYLSFGNVRSSRSKSIKFTPLSTISRLTSFYGLDIVGISVGGQKLSIPGSVFSTAGAIIDSGTVITRLPPAAYSALSSTFRQMMTKYQTAPALSILDTCYDFTGYSSVTVPKISMFFNGGVEVDMDFTGILYANKVSQVCLAFAGNGDAGDVAIFGNVQQKTMEVVYDGARGRVGFGAKGCA